MKRAIYIVDDEEPVRRSTRLMLMIAGYEVEAFESGSEFLNIAGRLRPGVVLLDLRMPEMDGLEVQRQLNGAGTPHIVIMLTGHGDIGVAVSALDQGASGFLEKPFAKDALFHELDRAFQKIEDPAAKERLEDDAATRIAALTEEERHVLTSLAKGLSNDAIAARMGVQVGLIEVHRANLLTGLGATTLVEALSLAFEAGVVGRDRA